MKTTIEIKSILGSVLFSFEKENNSVKDSLTEAVKQGAYLQGADLQGADLQGAYLRGAYLQGAYLRGADLRGAYLRGADLQGAYLRGADLRGADLQGADLRGADLQGADLQGADLRGADLKQLSARNSIVADGDIIGWKKLRGNLIAKLSIPAKAKRLNSIGSRKCRAEYAIVLAIYDGKKKVKEGYGMHDSTFLYTTGATVTPDSFDPDPRVECSNGIHFFITRLEAEEY